MPLEMWSPSVTLVRLGDDPQFSDDLDALLEKPEQPGDAILDFSAVTFLNSTNIAKLLNVRREMLKRGRMIVCGISDPLWGTFLVTGLDKIFTFTADLAEALASLQIR
jgi:anti-anti-sigma factor